MQQRLQGKSVLNLKLIINIYTMVMPPCLVLNFRTRQGDGKKLASTTVTKIKANSGVHKCNIKNKMLIFRHFGVLNLPIFKQRGRKNAYKKTIKFKYVSKDRKRN